MLNKKRFSLTAWVVILCMLLTALAGCTEKAPAETTAPAEPTVETAPPSPATSLAHEEEAGALMAWELNASAWSSSNGATVTLTAQPREYVQGQAAAFIVRLDDKEVENRSCTWDGTYYTASVDLEAADGYEYECVIFPAQGSGEHFPLSTAYDSLVYLKSSLTAYCNLYISDFKVENGKLTVTAGFAHVQLPQLSPDGASVSFEKAQLSFTLNGEEIEAQDISLPAGEGAGSHEASLSAISFTMPEMENDYQLDLYLNVTLSDGEALSANGGSWFYSGGELRMSAG